MKLYKGTGCCVTLVGILTEIPSLAMNERGDFVATINVHINIPGLVKAKQYDVIVLHDAALRIKRYGFPGLYLWIEGVLHLEKDENDVNAIKQNESIIAEKIIFLDASEPNASNVQNYLNFTPIFMQESMQHHLFPFSHEHVLVH